jgi:hypothetical protein
MARGGLFSTKSGGYYPIGYKVGKQLSITVGGCLSDVEILWFEILETRDRAAH